MCKCGIIELYNFINYKCSEKPVIHHRNRNREHAGQTVCTGKPKHGSSVLLFISALVSIGRGQRCAGL